MELRRMGTTGVRVSELCLGTMTFGDEVDDAMCDRMVGTYVAAGGNFIDTADVYGAGRAEEMLGRAVAARRDALILATKGGGAVGPTRNDRGASRRHLLRAVEASLRRLQTDWIDLYQVHWPDFSVAPHETLAALDQLVREGKVRYVGVCNYLGSHLANAVHICARNGFAPIVSHQPQYSLVCREVELETLPLCQDEEIAVFPWSPLGGGVLTGKYADGVPDRSRSADGGRGAPVLSERNLRIAETVRCVAAEIGRTPAQVALNWVVHRRGVTSPIIGARSVEQLHDILGAVGWQLDDAHRAQLGEASRVDLSYPHDYYAALRLRSYDP